MTWKQQPKRVLVLIKFKQPELLPKVANIMRYLVEAHALSVVVEPHLIDDLRAHDLMTPLLEPRDGREPTTAAGVGVLDIDASARQAGGECDGIDLVISLGGDGLLIHASTVFARAMPPVLGFNLGSLGFLTLFDYEEFTQSIRHVLDPPMGGPPPQSPSEWTGSAQLPSRSSPPGLPLSLRMRLRCTIVRGGEARGATTVRNVLNEVVVDRGPSPYLTCLECFCNGEHITDVQADGIILATPTGSTAYSMSAGGSMVHPSVPAICFTPICPHTLSFRPILFPDSATIFMRISEESRSGEAWVAFDGKFRERLGVGDTLVVESSPYPLPLINRVGSTVDADWMHTLRYAFGFNQRARQKSFPPPLAPDADALGDGDAPADADAEPDLEVDRVADAARVAQLRADDDYTDGDGEVCRPNDRGSRC